MNQPNEEPKQEQPATIEEAIREPVEEFVSKFTEERSVHPLQPEVAKLAQESELPPQTHEPLTAGPTTVSEPASLFPMVKQRKPKKVKPPSKAQQIQDAAQAVLDAVEEARAKTSEAAEAYAQLIDELEGYKQAIADRLQELADIRQDLYGDWNDNLPENLRQSPLGEKLQTLMDIDLEPDLPEIPEFEEPDFDSAESAAQEIMDAELPLGFGRD